MPIIFICNRRSIKQITQKCSEEKIGLFFRRGAVPRGLARRKKRKKKRSKSKGGKGDKRKFQFYSRFDDPLSSRCCAFRAVPSPYPFSAFSPGRAPRTCQKRRFPYLPLWTYVSRPFSPTETLRPAKLHGPACSRSSLVRFVLQTDPTWHAKTFRSACGTRRSATRSWHVQPRKRETGWQRGDDSITRETRRQACG